MLGLPSLTTNQLRTSSSTYTETQLGDNKLALTDEEIVISNIYKRRLFLLCSSTSSFS